MTLSSSDRASTRSRTTVVMVLGSTQTLAWASSYYLPAILALPIARDLGLSPGWVFAAFSAALLVTAALGPAAGREIDRRGGRDVLVVSNLVFAAGLVLLALAGGPWLLFAAWIVIGAGMAMGLYEAGFATLAGIYGRSARGPITGITLIAGFASTVGWPLSAWLDAAIGWRGACLVWAGLHLCVGLPLNRWLIPRATYQAPARTVAAGAPAADESVTPDRTLLLLAFVFAVTWFISTAMAAHLPRLLQDAGASLATAVAAAALVGPAQVMARLLEFGLMRRFHPLMSARLAALAHPAGAALLMVFGAPLAMLFTLLHGAGNGIMTIAKGTLPLVLFGPAGYGLRQGLLMAPARIGQAVAPLLFGLLLERFGSGALLFSTGLGLAGLVALLALRPAVDAD